MFQTQSYTIFYEPLIPPDEFGYHVIRLQENEEPNIYYSSDFDNDMNEILSEHYQCLGFANFNGAEEDITKDIRQSHPV